MKQLHVVFGTGALGLAVMRELRRRGHRVRMINRTSRLRFEKDMETELGGIDAANPAQTREVCEGATSVYHCAGLPYSRWNELPGIATGILEGAASAGARLVYGDNLYAYGAVEGPMTEKLPDAASTRKGRLRAEIAQMLLHAHTRGTARVSIGRGSDFFGPHATDSAVMGSRVFGRALRGKSALILGRPECLHSWTYVEDFGRTLVALAESEQAQGGVWHVPTGPALRTREFVERVFRSAGGTPRYTSLPRVVLAALGAFDRDLAELREMLYQFERDFVLDCSKSANLLGLTPTPVDAAIEATLEWYRRHSRP